MARRIRISEQVRKAVRESGLTHYRICKELDIDQATMSRFMRRKGGLSMSVLDNLGKLLDLRIVSNSDKGKSDG